MTRFNVDDIRPCLEGVIPAFVATCSADGVPNMALASQVEYIDAHHVALSFQFFNKTRENILAHPYATVLVCDNETGATYRLSLHYLHTETEGRLFQRMKVKLAGIASQTGMSGVFRLQGADVYEVLAIERVPGQMAEAASSPRNLLPAVRAVSERLSEVCELGRLFDTALDCLHEHFAIEHSMLLVLDEDGRRLYTVASHGYAASGVGSEIAMGDGVIGVAAEHATPIRIAYMATEYTYLRAVRQQAVEAGHEAQAEIPFPGIETPHSQLAVPIRCGSRLLGVLYCESPQPRRFNYDTEDALVAIAHQLGLSMRALQCVEVQEEASPQPLSAQDAAQGEQALIRFYAANASVFIDEDYLIKGVAGLIFWKLVREHAQGRSEFTNRELRLDPALRLPDIDDNLEARLILLARRLHERSDFLRIEKTGRGRFRFCVQRPLRLEAIAG